MMMVSYDAANFLQKCVDEERARTRKAIAAVDTAAATARIMGGFDKFVTTNSRAILAEQETKNMRYLFRVTIYDANGGSTNFFHLASSDDTKAKMKAYAEYVELFSEGEDIPDPDNLDIFAERLGQVRDVKAE